MKKVILIYVLIIILIAGLALLINTPREFISLLKFPHSLHIIVEGSNSFLMFLIFLVGNHLYSKTKDERFAVLAGGFLVGAMFNCMHVITAKTFPYDILSVANIQNNPGIVYLLFSNLILPLAVYFTLVHKPSASGVQSFRFNIYSLYLFIFSVLTVFPLVINFFGAWLKYDFNLLMHAFEFINYSLYIMLAFTVINIRQSSGITFFPKFTLGLVILGLGGLFYINPSIVPGNELLAHTFEFIGLVFILSGIKSLQAYALFLRFKDELVAYLCLMLISFYIILVSLASILFHIIFPPYSAYIFIEFILIFQFVVYLIANKLTQPITNIIDTLSAYVPGERPINIPVIRNDEIGLLTEKINATSKLSWEKISEISKIAQRERAIRRIFESMRRVFDQNVIKNTIMEEINTMFTPDRSFIALHDSENNFFYFDKYYEHLPSKTLVEFNEINEEEIIIKQFTDLFDHNIDICFANVEEYIMKNALKGTKKEELLREYNIKSCCNIPIYYANSLLGYVIIQYTSQYREFNKEELAFLNVLATQIGIAIHQAAF